MKHTEAHTHSDGRAHISETAGLRVLRSPPRCTRKHGRIAYNETAQREHTGGLTRTHCVCVRAAHEFLRPAGCIRSRHAYQTGSHQTRRRPRFWVRRSQNRGTLAISLLQCALRLSGTSTGMPSDGRCALPKKNRDSGRRSLTQERVARTDAATRSQCDKAVAELHWRDGRRRRRRIVLVEPLCAKCSLDGRQHRRREG